MANSMYEHVKEFETDDRLLNANFIVLRIKDLNFQRFCEINKFEKPNDERALNLLNACAISVLEKFSEIILAYGFSNEYSFVFSKKSKLYQRRASKILSVIVSIFSSVYGMKWSEFFPYKDMLSHPSFSSQVTCYPSVEEVFEYLAWRQRECHCKNLYNTCFWKLIDTGKSEREAYEILKGSEKQEKNDMLFEQFGINYKELPSLYRHGSCILKTEVDGVKRPQKKIIIVHSENIASTTFWNDYSCLRKELNHLEHNVTIDEEYVESFWSKNKLPPSNWIVIRIDGSCFRRFSDVHGFEKPNDEQALKLMNSCAMAVLDVFNDIVFAYGVSDEYSFVLKRNSQLYQRCASRITSEIVSFFTLTYVMKWKEFFPKKELNYPPSFDGRAVCYPSYESIRHYLAWRQVDCHINNHYNTCFWMLVKSGKSPPEAQSRLKGTRKDDKNEMLSQLFHIDYNKLPLIFRNGSCVFWDKDSKVVVEHSNIIEDSFWKAHPLILETEENYPRFSIPFITISGGKIKHLVFLYLFLLHAYLLFSNIFKPTC